MTSPPRPMARFQINFTNISRVLLFSLPKLLNGSAPLKQIAARAKNGEKSLRRHLLLGLWPDFKIFSQNYFNHSPLQILLNWFHSAEQDGRQSEKKKT